MTESLELRQKLSELIGKAVATIKWNQYNRPETPNEASFPTLCVCAVCNGHRGTSYPVKKVGGNWVEHPDHDNEIISTLIGLIQHGTYIEQHKESNWGGSRHFPTPCTCVCQHEFSEVNVGHCLHDWTCQKCGLVLKNVDSSD